MSTIVKEVGYKRSLQFSLAYFQLIRLEILDIHRRQFQSLADPF